MFIDALPIKLDKPRVKKEYNFLCGAANQCSVPFCSVNLVCYNIYIIRALEKT
jgi:hypothetical protein